MWEPRPLATLGASTACNRDVFTFYLYGFYKYDLESWFTYELIHEIWNPNADFFNGQPKYIGTNYELVIETSTNTAMASFWWRWMCMYPLLSVNTSVFIDLKVWRTHKYGSSICMFTGYSFCLFAVTNYDCYLLHSLLWNRCHVIHAVGVTVLLHCKDSSEVTSKYVEPLPLAHDYIQHFLICSDNMQGY
jgi:hypothetical protein